MVLFAQEATASEETSCKFNFDVVVLSPASLSRSRQTRTLVSKSLVSQI